jgi:hypothetical protein
MRLELGAARGRRLRPRPGVAAFIPNRRLNKGSKIMRRLFRTAICLFASVLTASEASAAQEIRYTGRATGAVLDTGALTADVGAGGRDSAGQVIIEKDCDVRQTTCFDESDSAGIIPGLLITASTRTVGGARTESGASNPGFPRVDSTAQASIVLLDGLISIAGAPVTATADSETGELSGGTGNSVLSISGQQTLLPAGQSLDIPGLLTIQPSTTVRKTEDGMAIIQVTGVVVLPDPNGLLGAIGPVTLGQAIAGIEEPFTEGGGGSGCSLAPRSKSSGGLELLAVVGALWWIARRRRVAA